jgi:uncharacterized membrane protein HdeD (DUF308 family)
MAGEYVWTFPPSNKVERSRVLLRRGDDDRMNLSETDSPNQTALQRWIARWNGPVFIVVGLFWLVTIPFTSGVMVLRWTLGIVFLIVGIGTTVGYLRARSRTNAKPLPPSSK